MSKPPITPQPETAAATKALLPAGLGVPSESDEVIAVELSLTQHQHMVLRALLIEQAARLNRERASRISILNPGSTEPEVGSVYRSVLAIMAKLDGTASTEA